MKNFLLLASLAITQVLGDILLSRGMKDFVGFDFSSPTIILYLIAYILTNYWILMGLCVLVISLSLYLTAISKLDLSYVLPIHASSYVLNGLFAWAFLGEHISGMRWVSTFIIAFGVLSVGLSDSQTSQLSGQYRGNIKSRNVPLFLLPLSAVVSKTWLAIFISSISDASGDLLLALGMKRIGQTENMNWRNLVKMVIKIVTNPMIISGIICQSIAFFSFISVLSWADISFVRPATALTYVISMSGAKFILKENIQEQKLLGIILIGVGVFMHR
ncbi:hypothetical protein [Crocosphaera sp. XPORK-15E]|uniref:hypothetical protein n=1 Tax=Crocosphaera sp. XPORK-15E TaxID=3110247 RepID=UPI002B2052D8|nr:hypothetical protein [Crocosphaera sp. XPORK-15E]MEA5533489.1 hypothetical protein [Crocosphaera sp. XPORK-15E]